MVVAIPPCRVHAVAVAFHVAFAGGWLGAQRLLMPPRRLMSLSPRDPLLIMNYSPVLGRLVEEVGARLAARQSAAPLEHLRCMHREVQGRVRQGKAR